MNFVIRGDLAFSKSQTELDTMHSGWLVCRGGVCRGIFADLPADCRDLPRLDFGGKLVIPGMVDLHIHAPQYAFRGLYMDQPLLTWLRQYAFPEESKYADLDYAERAYGIFAAQMRKSATTRAAVFATAHKDATLLLMEQMEKTGLIAYVGKVNMDRDAPDALREASAEASAEATSAWIKQAERFTRVKPILTPRFLPSCTETLLQRLGAMAQEQRMPVQSHLSENPEEVALVRKLMPDTSCYADGYAKYGLLGQTRTIMAHCVYSEENEIALLRENGVYVAHCPSSNVNIGSGFAPIRRFLDAGLRVGLGSDVAGGESESIFDEMRKAIVVSKMYRRYVDEKAKPLTFAEAFWLATRSGGAFFGKVGAFEPGYEADILVLDDAALPHPQDLSIAERLERAVYLGADQTALEAKFVAGERLF